MGFGLGRYSLAAVVCVVCLSSGCARQTTGSGSHAQAWAKSVALGKAFDQQLAFGPMPFVRVNNPDGTLNHFDIRADYAMLWQNPASWSEVAQNTREIELYYMMFQYPPGTIDYAAFASAIAARGK